MAGHNDEIEDIAYHHDCMELYKEGELMMVEYFLSDHGVDGLS